MTFWEALSVVMKNRTRASRMLLWAVSAGFCGEMLIADKFGWLFFCLGLVFGYFMTPSEDE